jgi:ferredoxin
MFAQHCSWVLLNNLAFDIIKELSNAGYKAVPTEDLNGTATKVAHTFGEVVDLRANAFAATAAGLAEVSWCGFPLTKEFGKRQRFYAIVTDAELPPDSMLTEKLCKQCRKCKKSCPVGAVSNQEVVFTLGEKSWTQSKIDTLRCDWAKRYGLVGDEGPKYMGSQTDIMPPDKIDADALINAMKRMDPLQKRIPCIVERCLMECDADK